ncbi:MAG: Stp1/IreP family PP2C-type Ser/Thr phosphatase [Streptosporangiaceae bacterium]
MSTPRIGIRYAARSDVGMLREGNEDSAFAGARLLAVADGMGGHVGGEIASAAAIETLRKLDTDVPADQLLVALEHSVKAANDKLHHIVEGDPSLQGMGTTLTAMLWSGSQVALVHIGDSRAYLLRNGELFQITHDHTLVQSLVDEGRISLDDAATHPQRSLLLRALDGRNEVEPDLSLREAQIGDRYLLCSDGLSGVVSAETIHQVLSSHEDPEQAIRQLIDLANRGGGPDNITCVVADVVDLDRPTAVSVATKPLLAGAAASKAQETPQAPAVDTPAQRAADHIRDTLPQPSLQLNGEYAPPPSPAPYPPMQQQQQAPPMAPPPQGPGGTGPQLLPPPPPRGRSKAPLLLGAVAVVAVLVAGAGFYGWHSAKSGYFLQADGDRVVLYQGKADGFLGVKFTSKAGAKEQPNVRLSDLPTGLANEVKSHKQQDGSLAEIRTRFENGSCKYTFELAHEGDLVVIKQASAVKGCQSAPVPAAQLPADLPPKVEFARLPKSAADQLNGPDGIKTKTLNEAVEAFRTLAKNSDTCQKDKNCPTQ